MLSVDYLSKFSVILFFSLIAVLCPVANGQPVELTKQQYDLAVARFQTSTNGVSRREITRTESLSNGRVIKTVDTVREVDGAGNRRILTKTTDSNGISESESIWIGSLRYTKKGTTWLKEDLSRGPFTGSGAPESSDVLKYSFEEVKNGPLVTFVFSSESIFNRETGKRFEFAKTHTNQYFWPQKSERTKSEGTPENVIERWSTTYDYDSLNIKIEAPIK